MKYVLGLFFITAGAFIGLMGMEVEEANNGTGGGVHYAICAASVLSGLWIMFASGDSK